jgi:flagellar biosynthesis chaperone FliJ
MKRGFRLASVLRARQAQEDAARGEVLRARRGAAVAAEAVEARDHTLANHQMPDEDTARALVAALTARQAMAASLALARQMAQLAESRVAERAEELTVAAQRRRTVEKLAERHAAERRRRDLQADQSALDELATTDPQRSAVREVRS